MPHQRSSLLSLAFRQLRLISPIVSFGLVLSLTTVAAAAPTPISINFQDEGGEISFTIKGQGGIIKSDQVQLSLSDERKTLLKIEVQDASTEKSKYWIKSFSESKSDPNIKGIMVRRAKAKDLIQIRVRYKTRIDHALKDQIALVEIPNGIRITAPRVYKSKDVVKKSEPKVSVAKPSLDPKLSKITSLTSSLSDDETRSKTPEARPSVFDRGEPVAPLPKMEKLRPTGLVSSTLGQEGSTPTSAVTTTSPSASGALGANAAPKGDKSSAEPVFQNATTLKQSKMYELDVPKPSVSSATAAQGGRSKDQVGRSFSSLDEMTTLSVYILMFLILLWGASYFFKRSKSLEESDNANSIKILSQKVIGLSPRQRIMVIETMGHTLVVGSCERGGLSHIAHLSTPHGVVHTPTQPAQDSLSVDSRSRIDALGSFGQQDQYYRDDGYPIDDISYRRSEQISDSGVTYEENTFVGEDEVYTAELPQVSHNDSVLNPMSNVDSYTNDQLQPDADQFADNSLSSVSSMDDEVQRVSANSTDEDDVNMKPGDLLQWIQKLNGTKG